MSEGRDTLAAGDPVPVSGRLIVPIVHILQFRDGFSCTGSVNPVAFLIIDGREVFFAPIDRHMDEERLATFLAEEYGITPGTENG
ncbi:MAG TPA: hypothetical protein PKY15_06095 [Methanoregulaceae archaeon]|jgi:hypothetical protein|nr:hypothetical protein [Methanoregulaceae archaeon]MDD5048840.1 hypothetical protein [Methanoregulaceae archaeon]MDD5685198.1 hypothetical protein [Methanoregulaceae archaeon]HPX72735.1 hypothetical protein [Methanoregulaceae archaeon]HQC12916.1 hypothetical protein [Methanoregulaceae archaeon]